MTSKHHNRRPDIIHVSRLTLPHVRRHFLAPVGFREIPVGCARKNLSAPVKIAEILSFAYQISISEVFAWDRNIFFAYKTGIFKPKCNCRRKSIQEKESLMVLRCKMICHSGNCSVFNITR